jgi:hypothetical protein
MRHKNFQAVGNGEERQASRIRLGDNLKIELRDGRIVDATVRAIEVLEGTPASVPATSCVRASFGAAPP